MGKADLHVHSTFSDGMASVAEIMRHVEARTDLDVIAIADHDQVAGALQAVEWCAGRPQARVQAVVGTEITAAWGRHVLALFFEAPYPTRPFPCFRSLARTVAVVHDAGGVVAVPHPLSSLVPSVGARALAGLVVPGGVGDTVHAVEVCSGVIGAHWAEARVRRLNAAHWGLAPVGNSDAHHLGQIGLAYTTFPGHTPADLKAAILGRATQAHWGAATRVPVVAHALQNWRSLVVKPARELRAALTRAK